MKHFEVKPKMLRRLHRAVMCTVVLITSGLIHPLQAAFHSTVVARANGSGEYEQQYNTFNPLHAAIEITDNGRIIKSAVSAAWSDPNSFSVSIENSWEWKDSFGKGRGQFGDHFAFSFTGTGGTVHVSATGVSTTPLRVGGSTAYVQDFGVTLFDTTAGTASTHRFGSDGTASFATVVGHNQYLTVQDYSNVFTTGAFPDLSMSHTGQFDFSGDFFTYSPVPEPTSFALWGLTGIGALVARRRKLR